MGQMATFYTFFWKLKMMTKPRIQLKNMMQFCWWRKGFNIPDLTENLTIKGLIVPDDNDDDDDNEDDSLEWSQGSHNQLDLSKTILKFYPSCFHHLARLARHWRIFQSYNFKSSESHYFNPRFLIYTNFLLGYHFYWISFGCFFGFIYWVIKIYGSDIWCLRSLFDSRCQVFAMFYFIYFIVTWILLI